MFKIISKPNCAFCDSAKSLFKRNNISYTESVLERDIKREVIIESYPNARTFPIITYNGVYIGGYTELVKFISEHSELITNTQQLIQE